MSPKLGCPQAVRHTSVLGWGGERDDGSARLYVVWSSVTTLGLFTPSPLQWSNPILWPVPRTGLAAARPSWFSFWNILCACFWNFPYACFWNLLCACSSLSQEMMLLSCLLPSMWMTPLVPISSPTGLGDRKFSFPLRDFEPTGNPRRKERGKKQNCTRVRKRP